MRSMRHVLQIVVMPLVHPYLVKIMLLSVSTNFHITVNTEY
jgi:hypothetical protein